MDKQGQGLQGADTAKAAPGLVSSLRQALKSGSAASVLTVLSSANPEALAQVLESTGFVVDPAVLSQGRAAIFAAVKSDLAAALAIRGDGFDLAAQRGAGSRQQVAPDHAHSAIHRDASPAEAIQRFMNAKEISVSLLGDAPGSQRDSLLMIASQAMERGVLGFGFDGIAGKFEVPLSMAELAELHADAGMATAVESSRAGLGTWLSGGRQELGEWIPDSVQRLLSGPLSLESAQAVLHMVESGAVGQYGTEKGEHIISSLLAEQGLDIKAPTVEAQAAELGLEIQEADRNRGRYFGTVVAQDHRAILVKTTRTTAIELAHADVLIGNERPKLGEALRLSFHRSELTVSRSARQVQERA